MFAEGDMILAARVKTGGLCNDGPPAAAGARVQPEVDLHANAIVSIVGVPAESKKDAARRG